MLDAMGLVGIVFSGLSALVIEGVEDAGEEVILVRAQTSGGAVACPGCGTGTARVHGYHERTLADVPVDGRRVSVTARLRRMRCPVLGCAVQTFREQVPDLVERYQRRTVRLVGQVSAVASGLGGRAGARLLPALGNRNACACGCSASPGASCAAAAACGSGSPNDGPGPGRSPPRSPACKPSTPADQPEHPYDQEGETPGPVEPRPPGATAGQPAIAGTRNHPSAEQLRPAHQARERLRLVLQQRLEISGSSGVVRFAGGGLAVAPPA
jgi:hypothetical protein